MLDLFTTPMTDKEKVFAYIKAKKWARTHDVIAFGLAIHSNRALRNAQALCQEATEEMKTHDFIRRMAKSEKDFRFACIKEDVFEYVP